MFWIYTHLCNCLYELLFSKCLEMSTLRVLWYTAFCLPMASYVYIFSWFVLIWLWTMNCVLSCSEYDCVCMNIYILSRILIEFPNQFLPGVNDIPVDASCYQLPWIGQLQVKYILMLNGVVAIMTNCVCVLLFVLCVVKNLVFMYRTRAAVSLRHRCTLSYSCFSARKLTHA